MTFDVKEFSKSNLAGFVAGLTYVLVSKLLDRVINPRISNIIGLLCGSVVNFVMQSYIFNCLKKLDKNICGKYIASEFIIMITNQILFMSIYMKRFNTTVTRICIAIIISLGVSFPLRKYWVFTLNSES
jgi:putative flippase GtrA